MVGFSRMDILKYKPTAGYTPLIKRGEMGMATLDFGMLNLSVGDSFFEDTADNQALLIVLSGQCTLLVGHNGNKAHGIIGERPNVFADAAYRVYIPCRTTYEVFADEVPLEVAICKMPSALDAAALILEPGDEPNEGPYELIASETVMQSLAGEAICLYRFRQEEGCIHQRIYNDDLSFDQCIALHHNDILALPPRYHAEAVEPHGRPPYCLWLSSRDAR
jgi:5-deoxy-D-glucuronate isomerase